MPAEILDDPAGEPAESEEVEARREVTVRAFVPIGAVTIDTTMPAGLLPEQARWEDREQVPPVLIPEIVDPRLWGGWAETDFNWSATRLCHRPLYFEQVNLERYGYDREPAAAAADLGRPLLPDHPDAAVQDGRPPAAASASTRWATTGPAIACRTAGTALATRGPPASKPPWRSAWCS